MNSEVNKTFDEVLLMTDEEFRKWILDVRLKIVDTWDNDGIPPVNGYSESEIISQFNMLSTHPVHEMFVKDELTGGLCIRNTHNKLGNACNSWFPTMMKTRIDYGNGKARSIYDFMKEDSLIEKYMPYGFRHFKRDSFYAYSRCVVTPDGVPGRPGVSVSSAYDWISKFDRLVDKEKFGFWLQEKEPNKEYTGYSLEVSNKTFLALTHEELTKAQTEGLITKDNISNLREPVGPEHIYLIRLFERGQKIFPIGLKSFRISVCQYAVNFPPVIAKAVWERYTEEFKEDEKVYVWDPSSGWGGRILGAMSVREDRNIVYLGNDPNTDHTIYATGVHSGDELLDAQPNVFTKYDEVATFYNTRTAKANALFPHTHEWKVWQLGSEEMQHNKAFQEYKGKLSMVFTSPPYFHREVYSEDATQSCHKFSAYEDWRDSFLYDTLKTAYDWLRPGGYICWNIASIKEGKKFVPLEEDSCEIMEKLGFEKVEILRLVLGQMPGGNRTIKDEAGNIISTNKNAVKLNGSFYRYEPIFVYRKPK